MTQKTTATVVDLQRVRDAANAPEVQAHQHLQLDRDADLSKASRVAANPVSTASPDPRDYEARRAKCIADCVRVLAGQMTRTALRKKYRGEYNSHRNMLRREKDLGREVALEWHDFARCLIQVGPRPSPDQTIDRLDNDDPEYAPGKVDWRNKKDQANNRSSTVFLTIDGEKQPVTIWAQRYRKSADTIRKRKREGWSDREAVFGREPPTKALPRKLHWPARDPETTEQRFQQSATTKHRLDWALGMISDKMTRINQRIDWLWDEHGLWEECSDLRPEVPPHVTEELSRHYDTLRRLRHLRWSMAKPDFVTPETRPFWHGHTAHRTAELKRQEREARRLWAD